MSHRHTRKFPVSALTLGVLGVMLAGSAGATGFQLRENSVKNLGRAVSGTAVAKDDASVVSNNPAAMVNFSQAAVQTDITVIDLTAEFSGSGNAAAGSPLQSSLRGGLGGDPGDPTAVPALAVVVPLSGAMEGLTVGASISAPFGLATEYDRDWMGRYHSVLSDVKVVDLTLSAALALTERFSVGVGLVYEHAEVTLTNAVDFGAGVCRSAPALCIPPATAVYGPQKNDGFVDVSGSASSLGWIAGVQWKPTDRLSLGFSHRSEVDHDLEGDVDFTVPGNVAPLVGAAYADGPILAPLTLPSVSTISVQYDFSDSFRMMADAQFTDWHSLAAVNIYRDNAARTQVGHEEFDWNDSKLYSLGAEFDLSESLTLRGGIAVDESPTHNATRSPRLPDNDRKLFSAGLTWRASEALSVDAAFMRIAIDTPTIDHISSSGSRLTGSFDGHANRFGVAAQYKF